MWEMKNILGGLLLASGFCLAYGQNAVDITGTITDSKSKSVIAGAKVSLATNPGVTTTTGADGKFHLTGNATVGIQAGMRPGKAEMSFKGAELSFSVAENNTPVSVDVYNLKSEHVRNLVSRKAVAGRYSVNASPAGLPAGLYLVRARVGGQTASFKMSTLGLSSGSGDFFRTAAFARTGLAKTAADVVDTLLVVKDGYKILAKPLTQFTGIFPLSITPKLPIGDLKIYSDRAIPQVDWGSNVGVEVWDFGGLGTKLEGGYAQEPFEGTQSWMVNFIPDQPYSAWGFVAKDLTPEDMSAWKNGSLHLALKGNAPSVAVTMASADQCSISIKVNLKKYGYLPDNAWHQLVVPLSDFEGTDFANIHIYCGLVSPVENDTTVFDPSSFYQVDDIYWKTTK
jgi:hypothetical protein